MKIIKAIKLNKYNYSTILYNRKKIIYNINIINGICVSKIVDM